MAFYLTSGELYEGETHVLAGNTYSGKTRTYPGPKWVT